MREAARCEGVLSLRAVHEAGDSDDAVLALAYEPGGARFVAVRRSGRACVHDARAGAALVSFDLEVSLAVAHVCVAFDVARRGIVCAFHVSSPVSGDGERGALEAGTHCVYLAEATGLVVRRLPALAGVLTELCVAPDGSAVWIALTERRVDDESPQSVRLYTGDLERLLFAFDGDDVAYEVEACGHFGADPDGRVSALLIDAARDRLVSYDPTSGELRATERLLPDWPEVRAASTVRCSSGGEVFVRMVVGEYDRMEDLLAARRLDPGASWRQLDADDWYSSACVLGQRVACVVDHAYERVDLHSLDDGRSLGACLIDRAHGYVCSVALAPDDRALLIGTNTGEVLVLSIDPRP